ncbi:MAG: hypothetical protein CEE38_13120 [Planctomycetes bacterium B3_Pla]|nr:MAG: hypothetical protein CEE38_13120 [Planctomycetes bacterium B3_Pla]
MDSQDIIRIGRRAKLETEAFINRHLNDRDKGWPKTSFWGSTYAGCPQERRDRERGAVHILQTQ